MRQIRFRALISLDRSQEHPSTLLHASAEAYPSHTRALMVRARSPREPSTTSIFASEICWDDDQPMHPGDSRVATVTVTGQDAPAFFEAGCRFTLWSGSDVGHGIVSRRVYTQYGPS
jgi:hypothetical protein